MWTLRSASNSIKNQVSSFRFLSLCHVRTDTAMGCFGGSKIIFGPSSAVSDLCFHLNKFYYSNLMIPECLFWKHTFSSQTDLKNYGADDIFLSEDEEASGSFDNFSESVLQRKKIYTHLMESEFYKTITGTSSANSFDSSLDKLFEDGKGISKEESRQIMYLLRKVKYYAKALQFSEWLFRSKMIFFDEIDFANRVYLIGMVKNIQLAEVYMNRIPSSFRREYVYRSFFSLCVSSCNVKKAEEIFNKMKDLKLSISISSFNKLLDLYMKFNREKIPGLLQLMEESNVNPTSSTYKILIEAKGRSKDFTGMEDLYKKMKAPGLKNDMEILSILLKHYIYGGLNEKATEILKEIEGRSDIEKGPAVSRALLPFYAALGKSDDVKRLWKDCQPNPFHDDYIAAIEAWGKLENFEEAEAVFEEVVKKSRPSSKTCYTLLRVYAEHRELGKAKSFLKRLIDNGFSIHSSCWDLLAKLYLDAGELEKADLALHWAVSSAKERPWFTLCYLSLMKEYGKKGDVYNCERIFQKSKTVRQPVFLGHFQALLDAYTISKTPAYGLIERMRAENMRAPKAWHELCALRDTDTAELDLFE